MIVLAHGMFPCWAEIAPLLPFLPYLLVAGAALLWPLRRARDWLVGWALRRALGGK